MRPSPPHDRLPGRPLAHVAAWGLGAALVGFTLGGELGLFSALIGVGGTAAYLGATWALIWAMGRSYAGGSLSGPQMLVIFVALMLKFPLIFLAWKAVQGLGSTGPTGFLVGLASVYCALIGWAVVTARSG